MTTTRGPQGARGARRRVVPATVLGALVLGVTGTTGAPATATAATTAAGPSTAALESMPNVWWYDAMKLGEVHRTATGKGVKVAVIDGYLDPKVPDLQGAKISKGDSCRGKPVPYLSGDLADHGTAMTTAIVGQGAGGKGVVGVAPDAEVRFYSFDADPEQKLVECDAILIAKQVDKAVEWGADVISMSIGTGGGLEDSIQRAWDAGAVVVAASGEVEPGSKRAEEALERPASTMGVVAVAAADYNAKVWSKNPYSADFADQYLTLAAPGVEVPIGGFPRGQGWLPGGIRTGTSPATAITAGAFAVLKSRWPDATGNQLIQSVVHHTGGVDEPMAYDKVQGYGILSLAGALKVDPTGYPDENPLLKAPPEARTAYPESSYEAGGSTEESTTEDDGASAQGDDDPSPAASEDGAAVDDGSSVPVWAVALGVLVLLGLAGGALLLRRRSGDRPTTAAPGADDQTTSTTYDHTGPRGS